MKDPEVVKLVQQLHLLLSQLNDVTVELQRQGMRVTLDAKDTGETVNVAGYPMPIKTFVAKHLHQTVSYDEPNTD